MSPKSSWNVRLRPDQLVTLELLLQRSHGGHVPYGAKVALVRNLVDAWITKELAHRGPLPPDHLKEVL